MSRLFRRCCGLRVRHGGELQKRINLVPLEGLPQLLEELADFDDHHAVSCLERFAAAGQVEPRLVSLLVGKLEALEASTVARLGAVAVQLELSEVVDMVSGQAVLRARDLGNRELAVLARAMAHGRQREAVQALLEGAAPRAGGLGARALVRLTWAAARAQWRGPDFDVILEEAASRAARLRPEGMSNLMWAMATLRHGNQQALRSLLPHLTHRCKDLTPQGLATALWALAALHPGGRPGWMEEDTILRLSKQALRRIEAFGPEDLGSLARSVATFTTAGTRGGDLKPLAEAVLLEATRAERLGSLSGRQLARLLGAMAAWRCREQRPLELLVEEVTRKQELRSKEMAAIIWASRALQVSGSLIPVLSKRIEGEEKDLHHFEVVSGLLAAAESKPDWQFLEMEVPKEAPSYQLAAVVVAAARFGLNCQVARSAILEAYARAERGELEVQDCALLARGFVQMDSPGMDVEKFLEALSRSFLERVARPIEGSDTGRDWADMVEALLHSDHPAGSARAELLSAFEEAVVAPLLAELHAIATSRSSLKPLEDFAASLGLPGLGPELTRQVLRRSDLATEADWTEAREAYRVRRWSSDQRLAWLSYGDQGLLVSPGAVEQVHGLRPLALPGVSAPGRHAEHQALVKALGALRASSQGPVKVYAFGATPCLSFLAALAQLRRLFPKVRVSVGFDHDVARMPRI